MFLVGIEDGLLPLRREGQLDLDDEEEERRLAYVGMTRAKQAPVPDLGARRAACTASSWPAGRRRSSSRCRARCSTTAPPPPAATRSARTCRSPPARSRQARYGRSEVASASSSVPPARGDPGPGDTGRGVPSHPDGWRPGLKVRHASFGSGVILQVQGTGAQTRLVVYFDRAGRKTLIPSLAKLERA